MLKLSEQKERQQLRVDADELRLNNLRDRLQKLDDSYDTRLNNLKERLRVDTERDQKAIDNYDSRFQEAKSSLSRAIADQEFRVRVSKENLAEVSRVESERGGDADAVRIDIFPAPAEAPKVSQLQGGPAVPATSAEKVAALNQAEGGSIQSATTDSGGSAQKAPR